MTPPDFGPIAPALFDLGPVHTGIAREVGEDEPMCALVIAVYAAAPW